MPIVWLAGFFIHVLKRIHLHRGSRDLIANFQHAVVRDFINIHVEHDFILVLVNHFQDLLDDLQFLRCGFDQNDIAATAATRTAAWAAGSLIQWLNLPGRAERQCDDAARLCGIDVAQIEGLDHQFFEARLVGWIVLIHDDGAAIHLLESVFLHEQDIVHRFGQSHIIHIHGDFVVFDLIIEQYVQPQLFAEIFDDRFEACVFEFNVLQKVTIARLGRNLQIAGRFDIAGIRISDWLQPIGQCLLLVKHPLHLDSRNFVALIIIKRRTVGGVSARIIILFGERIATFDVHQRRLLQRAHVMKPIFRIVRLSRNCQRVSLCGHVPLLCVFVFFPLVEILFALTAAGQSSSRQD
ncbi:MAG TPA: hypothetical protein VGB07_18150 [Blastocatellia bacterium]